MISVSEKISSLLEREQQLHTSLDNLRGQRSKVKEHKQLDKELTQIIRKRQNLESLARFEVGMPVHRADSRCLGKVTEIVITPGGLGQVWVSWDGKTEIPEQPDLLEPDAEAIAGIIQVGDRIIIGDSHAARGKTFTVAKLLARGWVESTDEDVFPREYWTKVESPGVTSAQEWEERATGDATPVITPEIEMVEQSPHQELAAPPESSVAVETLATTELEGLSDDEEKERHCLELKVDSGFREMVQALKTLRDKRLYRSTHQSFEAYAFDRFGKRRSHTYRLISAAIVIENLEQMSPIGDISSGDILPTTESQCREVGRLPTADLQREAWGQILNHSSQRNPTIKEIKGIVERIKEKPLALARDYCSIGDVFTLTRLEGTERKYNGCWAIASELRDFTIAVDVHDTTLTVKSENLQPIDFPDVRRQLPQTLKRIRRLRDCGLLDRCAYTILESLGRQVYLTDFEDKLLTFMEQEHGIIDQC